jgi:hypothetical protein
MDREDIQDDWLSLGTGGVLSSAKMIAIKDREDIQDDWFSLGTGGVLPSAKTIAIKED